MEELLVSVIVPVYNVSGCLDRCVQSIVNQSYKKIEIILVNDGSTDDCKGICEKWSKRDQRILLLSKKNGGVSDARNYGLKKAKGRFIAFVDSDDWIHPDMITLMYTDLMQTGSDMVCCGMTEATDSDMTDMDWFRERRVLNAEEAMDYLIEDKIITSHVMVKMYKREILGTEPFPKGKLYEDVWIMHGVFAKCARISVIPERLYFYYQRENSITKTPRLRNRIALVEALQKRYDDVHELKKLYNDELLCQIALNYSTGIVRNEYTKDELKGEMEKIKEMQLFLKRKDVAASVKKHAERRECWYYAIARIASYHAAGTYGLVKRIMKYMNTSLDGSLRSRFGKPEEKRP